jgi:hypothetical protein
VTDGNGTQVLIDMTGDIPEGTIMTVDAASGKYAIPFIAPTVEGNYQATLEASIPNCESCQGDRRMLTVQVGDGDSDDDGIPDEEDLCSGTRLGIEVDSTGCPVASSTDTDGDGVMDDQDQCPGTGSGLKVDANGCAIEELIDSDGDGYPDSYDAYPDDSDQWYTGQISSTEDVESEMSSAYSQQQFYQNSIKICIKDADSGIPIYDSSIKAYHTGMGSISGVASGPSGQGGPGDTPYNPVSGGAYGTTGYPNGYGQAWRAVQSTDNCRIFMGYTSTRNMGMSSVLSNFHVQASASGYESYDSQRDKRNNIHISAGDEDSLFVINIELERKGSAEMGMGTITNPAREIEVTSATWKAQDSERKSSTNIHPLVTNIDKDANLEITYSIGSGASTSLDYAVDYELSGGSCYEIEGSGEREEIIGGRSLGFSKGQETVTDYVTLYSKQECWNRNDPGLESEFTLSLEGRLLQIGDNEAKGQEFMPARVKVKPVVGAVKSIRGVSDLSELNGIMNLADGVATVGSLPYCIDEEGNTGDSKIVSTRGVSDRTAAEQKIILEFEGTNSFPNSLMNLAGKVSEYIRERIGKSPVDCKAYVKVHDNYMGHIEVGQRGFSCNDARYQVGAKKVQPWEKLFCDTIESGTPIQVQLGGSYTMKVDST